MFILGLITGIGIAILNVVCIYIFRAEIHTAINKSPLKKPAEFIDLEDPLEHVKKMLQHD